MDRFCTIMKMKPENIREFLKLDFQDGKVNGNVML